MNEYVRARSAGLMKRRNCKMPELSNLAYLAFEVSDLRRWESFAVDVLGMQAVAPKSGSGLYLRMDEYSCRIQLQEGPLDDLLVAGWEIGTESELEAYVERVTAAGGEVQEGDGALRARRGVERVFVCKDPNGFMHEFFFGPTILPISQKFASKVLSGPGFRTGALGLGHILSIAKDYAASCQFYRDVLGLRISDYIRAELAPGMVVDATFFHSATGRHHSLATAGVPSSKRLNHFMVELADMNDVGMAFDRANKAEIPIVLELGHHPNDHMFSFYMQTPSGFAVEVGSGGLVIEESAWKVVNYTQLSDWGHKRVRPSA
jgi:2,3-dihydroxybiphenyl 1,2-dioxygenase